VVPRSFLISTFLPTQLFRPPEDLLAHVHEPLRLVLVRKLFDQRAEVVCYIKQQTDFALFPRCQWPLESAMLGQVSQESQSIANLSGRGFVSRFFPP
jgi:hypothetical protein